MRNTESNKNVHLRHVSCPLGHDLQVRTLGQTELSPFRIQSFHTHDQYHTQAAYVRGYRLCNMCSDVNMQGSMKEVSNIFWGLLWTCDIDIWLSELLFHNVLNACLNLSVYCFCSYTNQFGRIWNLFINYKHSMFFPEWC